jgi:hypothetical protein
MDRVNHLDFIYIALYGGCLLAFSLVCFRLTGQRVYLLAAALTVGIMVADVLENIQLLAITRDLGTRPIDDWLTRLRLFTWPAGVGWRCGSCSCALLSERRALWPLRGLGQCFAAAGHRRLRPARPDERAFTPVDWPSLLAANGLLWRARHSRLSPVEPFSMATLNPSLVTNYGAVLWISGSMVNSSSTTATRLLLLTYLRLRGISPKDGCGPGACGCWCRGPERQGCPGVRHGYENAAAPV